MEGRPTADCVLMKGLVVRQCMKDRAARVNHSYALLNRLLGTILCALIRSRLGRMGVVRIVSRMIARATTRL